MRRAAGSLLIEISKSAAIMYPDVDARVNHIALADSSPRNLRSSAMRVMIDRYIAGQETEYGAEILALIESKSAEDRSRSSVVKRALKESVYEHSSELDRLTGDEHAVVRDAAARQIKAWRRIHPDLPYSDIAVLQRWKELRIEAKNKEIAEIRQTIRDNPSKKNSTYFGMREAPSERLAQERKVLAFLKRSPLMNSAVYQLDEYHLAIEGIAKGERRADERVERRQGPRDPLYLVFEDKEWVGSNLVVANSETVEIDLDAILGPRRMTEELKAELLKPDHRHRHAIGIAKRTAARLFMLTPETLREARSIYQRTRNLSDGDMYALPPRP